MSKKLKYSAVRSNNPFDCEVQSKTDIICRGCTYAGARKIARALNAMEDKPKAKAFTFDWTGIDPKYKWAAMDGDGQWAAYKNRPIQDIMESWDTRTKRDVCFQNLHASQDPYPGDWRDSLQKRP